ncbi:MAG: excisionase family DNA binding protein [Cyclobacteriaceae bacterium]|jgi:excisionase family DNA binding protein
MNSPEHYRLLPAEPVIERLESYERRLALLEQENKKMTSGRPENRNLTRDEACHQLKCKLTKLHELINNGHLTSIKLGRRTLITQESIDRYIARLTAKK